MAKQINFGDIVRHSSGKDTPTMTVSSKNPNNNKFACKYFINEKVETAEFHPHELIVVTPYTTN